MKLDWGKSIFLFFVGFVSLGIAFIIFSLRQNNDLVTDDYYEQGANYSQQIVINNRSKIFSDSISIMQDEDNLKLIICDSIVSNTDSLRLNFYYAADKNKDYIMVLSKLSASSFISAANLSHGRYTVKIYWHMNNEDYYLEKNLFIKH